MCQTDGWRETRQIAKLTDNFFSWPLYAVLSSRPHLALLPHLGRGCSSRGSWGLLPSAVRSHWLQAGSDSGLHSSNFNCHGHLHILFHNAHLLPIRFRDLLPLIYTGASLSDSSVKGQYVTLDMTLNWIWFWGSSFVDLKCVENLFIGINPKSTLTRSVDNY